MMYGWGHGGWMDGGGAWMILGWLWMIFVWLIPLFILFALAKYLLGSAKQNTGKKARAILDEAYARGDLSREDYLQKKKDLQNASS